MIESILDAHKEALGVDFVAYRNHVYRVYYLSRHFCPFADADALAVSAAFHDLGIWTAHTWDYLPPSIADAESWLRANGKSDNIEKVSRIIDFHHLRGRYTGDYAWSVEAFRRADWLDLSLGTRYRKGATALYRQLKKAFPWKGFHGRLIVFFLRNLIRHPLKPFPMFK